MLSFTHLGRHWLYCLAVVFCSLASQAVAAEQLVTPSAQPDTLVVGVISTNPNKAVSRTKPFADYLAANLQQHGITDSRVAVAKDVNQMARWLKQGRVDLVSESVFSAGELHEKTGAPLLARRWKSGVAEYSTVFFAHRDSAIDTFDDLLGKTIVFEDRGSTTAFFIPASLLLEQGYELYELTSPREEPPADRIGYLFADELTRSGGELNMSSWVYNKVVAAAAFSNLDWEKEIPTKLREGIHIFYQSQAVPRAVVLARPAMATGLQADIKSLLLSAHETEQGRSALLTYKRTRKFDEIGAEMAHAIEWALRLKQIVDEQLIL